MHPRRIDPNLSSLRLDVEQFPANYYTGADVRLFFGDIFVDQINSIEFALEIQVRPIYGYASYTPDDISEGARIVRGTFMVPFRESGYIYNVLKAIEDGATYADQSTTETITIDELSRSTEFDLDKMAAAYERSVWGVTRTPTTQQDLDVYDNLFGTDMRTRPFFPLQQDLSITITYGEYLARLEGIRQGKYDDKYRMPYGAVHSLYGVKLTGIAQQVPNVDQPVMEVYTFIAKDLDRKRTT